MSRSEQLSVTRPAPLARSVDARPAPLASSVDAECAARRSLRKQIARLERELSHIVADCFPDIAATPADRRPSRAPRLLDLAELELERDALVARLSEAEAESDARAERHRQARTLLAAMQLEPGRYKFMRLRSVDLGESGCGVWQVRPRLGLIGMLAGWWQVKLSSGCPLERGRAVARPDS